KPVVFGRCLACDDVVVHLTYPETDPSSPSSTSRGPAALKRSLRTVLRGRISNGSPLIASSLGSSVEVSIIRIRVLTSGSPGPRWSGRAADRQTTATGCVRPAARRQVVSQSNAKPSRAAYDGQGRPGANGQGTEAGGAKGG